MSMIETDVLEIRQRLCPLVGKKAWGVSLGVGSFITLEFGASIPYSRIPDRFHGEWHLWVTYCVWRLEVGSKVIAGSEDPRPELKKAVQHLEGAVLRSIVLTPPALETTFVFDDAIILHLFPVYTKEFEHWLLYTPDGNVLRIGPGSSWSYTSASEPFGATTGSHHRCKQ
jgi:hypothetical protein